MIHVIDIDKNKPVWDTAYCVCLTCGTHWLSVIHMDAPRNELECAACRECAGMIQSVVFRSLECKPRGVIQEYRRGFYRRGFDYTPEFPAT